MPRVRMWKVVSSVKVHSSYASMRVVVVVVVVVARRTGLFGRVWRSGVGKHEPRKCADVVQALQRIGVLGNRNVERSIGAEFARLGVPRPVPKQDARKHTAAPHIHSQSLVLGGAAQRTYPGFVRAITRLQNSRHATSHAYSTTNVAMDVTPKRPTSTAKEAS